jgi:hypothetical protein
MNGMPSRICVAMTLGPSEYEGNLDLISFPHALRSLQSFAAFALNAITSAPRTDSAQVSDQ